MANNENQHPTSLSELSGNIGTPENSSQYQAAQEIPYEVKQVDQSQPDYAMVLISFAVVTFYSPYSSLVVNFQFG